MVAVLERTFPVLNVATQRALWLAEHKEEEAKFLLDLSAKKKVSKAGKLCYVKTLGVMSYLAQITLVVNDVGSVFGYLELLKKLRFLLVTKIFAPDVPHNPP